MLRFASGSRCRLTTSVEPVSTHSLSAGAELQPAAGSRLRITALQNCAAEGFGRYLEALAQAGAHVAVIAAYDEPALPLITEVDAVLVGGTPISAYEAEKHAFLRAEMRFLEQALSADMPCFGICFGAQLLARLLGSEVRPAGAMEIGGYEVSLTAAGAVDPVLDGFPPSFPVFHWHGDTFAIPAGGERIVQGDGCVDQMFRHGDILGAQFHLETTHEEAAAWADQYAPELESVGKSKRQVVHECSKREPAMGRLATRLMRNFVRRVA